MIVMPSNNGKWQVHFWQGKYGGLGHLYSIEDKRGPFEHLPYALDNGRYPAFSSGKVWDECKYYRMLEHYAHSDQKPMWALVPDVVTDPLATLAEWDRWLPIVRDAYKLTPAFAVQDGHEPKDVPREAEVIFVGGSTEWKREHIGVFCKYFKRVHVGRINTYKWLTHCAEHGAESCDGTGWFRGDKKQLAGLEQFLMEQQ